jgi:peptide/nickel transport system substrate-binding protein
MQNSKDGNIFKILVAGVVIVLVTLSYPWVGTFLAAESPQYGGILTYAVATDPPTFDHHRETTFTVMHPIAPHYSLLLKFDPENYPKIVGDLAESWIVSGDYKTYTFKIRKGVKFHDGSILTSKDIKATYDKIIFPPSGVFSARKALYSAVDKVESPDDYTLVFRLKWPAAAFLGSLASPFNFVYKGDLLAKDPHWYEKNIMGTGPFKFVEHVAGSHWIGKRNENYFVKGRPFLDGYRAIFIKDTGARVAAIRGGRALAEFRFFTPSQRDDVVHALRDKIRVQETPLISTLTVIFNCEKKPYNDPRVRRALTLALDRWEGSKALSRISTMKWVGGLLRPGSEYAMNEKEITQIAGFSKDIEASRKEARRLLREAGVPEGFSFELDNRPPAMPFEPTAIWLIDQWRHIGLNAKQKLFEEGTAYNRLRSGNYDVAVNAISDFMDEPDIQLARFISSDKSPFNYGRYQDPILDELYNKQSRAMDPVERRKLCRQFEKRVLDDAAYAYPVIWMHRIVLHSPKMKGWKILPSHFLNQDLANVWLDKD